MNFNHWFVPHLIDTNGEKKRFDYPTSKVVCVGRNYSEHAKELNNPVPQSPLFFLKPNSSLVEVSSELHLPDLPYSCHYETELALLFKQSKVKSSANLFERVAGIGLALDLTLRDLQQELKEKGKPWEKAKSFDGACVVTEFLPMAEYNIDETTEFRMWLNDQICQVGKIADMIFPIETLITEAEKYFSLCPGDILLTGTPAGVGKLAENDELNLEIFNKNWQTRVVSSRVNTYGKT